MIKSLIINPGSTSTKLGVFEDENLIFEETLRHTTEEISQFEKIVDQVDFRKEMILNFLKDKDIDINSFDVIEKNYSMDFDAEEADFLSLFQVEPTVLQIILFGI